MATRVGEIYAELSIDDSRFQRTLRGAEASFTGLRSAAERAATQVNSSFSSTGANIERGGLGARNAARDVGRMGEAAQSAARDVQRIERAAGEAATATRNIEVPAGLATSARRATEALNDLGSSADHVASGGGRMGDSFVGGFADKVKGLGGKGGPIAMALVSVAGIGLAAGAALAKAVQDGMQVERDRDLIQARLGVNDETMQVIGAAAGAAFTNGWGESVTANMTTIQQAMKGGLLTGEETAADFQPMVEKLTAVNDLIEGDMSTTIRAVSGLIKNGLVMDAYEAFDVIIAGFQKGGDAGDDLIDTIGEYSNGWKNTGFSGKFAIGLINQAVANGVDVADRAGDAIREFGRRMTEEPDKIKEAITDLQLPADDLIDKLKKGGDEGEIAFDQIFDAIRQIDDPLKRNQVTMALLGDTAGDFIDAFGQWDPSKAAAGMGEVAGAAENAMKTIGSNSASHMEQASRSITASMDDVKLALAEGFGPTLTKVADWVSTHKPEIISFFTGLADAGLACLDGLISFTSGSLRVFADFQQGTGEAMGSALAGLGGFTEKLGGIIKLIPGMKDTGTAIQGAGSATKVAGEFMSTAADKARAMADTLDQARPVIDNVRDSVRNAGQTASGAAEMTRLFGGAVEALPEGKSLVVEALTADAEARLTAFGFNVEHLPNGQTKITANTAEAQSTLDGFIRANNGRKITTYTTNEIQDVRVNATKAAGGDPNQGLMQGPVKMPDGTYKADGGIDLDRYADGKLPDHAEIKPAAARLIQWAEPETGGEAFIPLAQAKRSRSLGILADVAARFGYDLMRFADGGVTVGKNGLDEAKAFAKAMAGTPYQWGGFESGGFDCSGLVSAVINKAVGRGEYASRMSTATEGAWLTGLGAHLGRGVAGTLRVGWTNEGVGHTAGTFPDGTNFEANGTDGVLIGGPTGADHPMFTDHAFFDVAGDAGGPAGSTGTPGSGGDGSGGSDGARVFVTNWPGSGSGDGSTPSSGTTTTSGPKTTFSARLFADGTEDHRAQIANAGDMRVWAEPETGGEAYIPLSVAKRARSTAILRQVAERFGFSLTNYANGGFGGVGSSGDCGEHAGSWSVITQGDAGDVPLSTPGRDVPLANAAAALSRAFGFGVGGLLTLASGWDKDGNFQGFDTSNGSINGLDSQLESLTTLLTEIRDAAQKGEPVEVSVDIDAGTRQANLNITRLGL
ncbi:phage tail tape measure protein [Nocardia niigatensis]